VRPPAGAVPSTLGWRRPELGSAALALLLYLRSLPYGFVRDDQALIRDNVLLRGAAKLGWLLTSDFWASASLAERTVYWRPVIVFSYWLDGRIAGWSPAWFHLVNALWHAAATAFLATAVSATGAGIAAAWFAGLWFASMPLHHESVAWIAGRTDVWSAAFVLGALAWETADRRGAAARWLGPLLWALGLLSKETAVAALPALGVAIWLRQPRGGRGGRELLLRLIPYLAVTLAYLAAHQATTGLSLSAQATDRPTLAAGIARGLALVPVQLLFLVPGHAHGPDWQYDRTHAASAAVVVAGALVHLILAAAAWRALRRRHRLATPLLLAWFPLLFLGALAVRSEPLAAERHLYLTSAGWAWLGGAAFAWLAQRARRTQVPALGWAPRLLALGWLCLSASATWSVIPVWRDERSVFEGMLRAQPRSATGWVGWAMELIEAGDDDAASRALDQAAALEPGRGDVLVFRAGIELRRGHPDRTLALAREARARFGSSRDVALLEVQALQSMGRWSEASRLADGLQRRMPGDTGVLEAWALQALAEGRPQDAARKLSEVVRLEPRAAGLLELLGRCDARLQAWASAREAFQRSVVVEPDRYDAWLGLAEACARSGDPPAAVAALRQAARLPAARDGRAERMLAELGAPPR
jgi:tetratricopeptide (TPR) repeat protein